MLCRSAAILAFSWWVSEAARICTLASLTLRHGDLPIDLDTMFEPDITQYSATLDFAMDSFSVNVRPDTGCEAKGVPKEPVPVRIGASTTLTLYAQQLDTGAQQDYTVTVSRLLGSETELLHLEIEGGHMQPIYDPKVRSYDVHLQLAYDHIRIVYRLLDNGQRLRASAKQQHPTGQALDIAGEATTRNSDSTNTTSVVGNTSHRKRDSGGHDESSRRLAPIHVPRAGEIQQRDVPVTFMLDVGFSRTLEVSVQATDSTQASIGTYRLHVSRAACSPKRPYFHPSKRICVLFCPAGLYRNDAMHRCSYCNTNCKQCKGLLECQMCMPDTVDYSYTLQPDGKCKASTNHLFKQYQWWCAGLGVLLLFLVLFGCAGVCQLCCTRGSSHRHQKVRTYDSDSDEMPLVAEPGRRLAKY